MRQKVSVLAALMLVAPSLAFAHVRVTPRESRPGVEETYTVRVPTEGQVPTTSVFLEVPEGMTVTDVPKPHGGTAEVKKDGNRIVAITWTQVIAPKQSAEFVFTATNPAVLGQVTWKVQQRFTDGRSSPWTPGTKLTNTPAAPTPPASAAAGQAATGRMAGHRMAPTPGDTAVIEQWLDEYDAAFNAKDLDKLATFYHSEATIYEGGRVDHGWASYRDGHLGPELKAFEQLQFGHGGRTIHLLGDGKTAYAVSTYTLKARMGELEIDSEGLATYLLLKGADGAWKIRHSHTSSRPVRRPPAH